MVVTAIVTLCEYIFFHFFAIFYGFVDGKIESQVDSFIFVGLNYEFFRGTSLNYKVTNINKAHISKQILHTLFDINRQLFVKKNYLCLCKNK